MSSLNHKHDFPTTPSGSRLEPWQRSGWKKRREAEPSARYPFGYQCLSQTANLKICQLWTNCFLLFLILDIILAVLWLIEPKGRAWRCCMDLGPLIQKQDIDFHNSHSLSCQQSFRWRNSDVTISGLMVFYSAPLITFWGILATLHPGAAQVPMARPLDNCFRS